MKDNKGNICILLSALAFSLGGLLIKLIPWSSVSIVGGRCFFSSMVIAGYIYMSQQKLVINKTTILSALFVAGNMFVFVYSTKLTTAANASILEYTAPIYIILINYFLFKIKPSKVDVLIVFTVFFGIIFVFIDGLAIGNMFGNVLACFGGLLYAVVIMMNNFKGGDSLSSMLLGHILSGIIGAGSIIQETNFSTLTITYVALLGLVQSGLGYLLLAIGSKMTKPLNASLIASVEPVLNPVLVALFYGETMSKYALVGFVIVIVSIIFHNIYQIKVKENLAN